MRKLAPAESSLYNLEKLVDEIICFVSKHYFRLHTSNTVFQETLPCRKLATYHPIESVGVLVGAWVPRRSCNANSTRDSK